MAWTDMRKILGRCPPGSHPHNIRAFLESLANPDRPRETVTIRPDGVRFHKCEPATHDEPDDFNRRVDPRRPRMIRGAE